MAAASSSNGDGNGERSPLSPTRRQETLSSRDSADADADIAQCGPNSNSNNEQDPPSSRNSTPTPPPAIHLNSSSDGEGEGLEVVISQYSDDLDAVEFKLPDDGSSPPLDATMSRAASSHSLASTRSGGSASLGSYSLGGGGGPNTIGGNGNGGFSAGSVVRAIGAAALGKPPMMPLSSSGRRAHSTGEMPPLGNGNGSNGNGSNSSGGGIGRRRLRPPSPGGGGGGGGPGSGRLSRRSSLPVSSSNGGATNSNNSPKPPLRRTVSDTAATCTTTQRRQRQKQKRPGVVAMAKMGYQECVNAIIRPPRAKSYKDTALGPPVFRFGGQTFARQDVELVNGRSMVLKCSHWTNTAPPAERVPCVIYMHGNSSARLEVLPQLSYLLSLGVSVFSLDFSGSGKSGGDYVSLGYYERDDLATVIDHLRSNDTTTSTIALWGRSMGAATCLMHAPRDPSIACMVVDSAFADLTQLATEMVERGKEHGVNVPGFVTSMALRMIRGSVKKQAGFDIRHCSPIRHAEQCFVPALFVHGRDDVFIKRHHSQDIHERYAGDKNIIVVEGDHNSPRPRFMFDSAGIFLQTCLQIPPDWTFQRNPQVNPMAPPWLYPGAMDGLRDQDEHGLAAPFSRSLSSSSGGFGPAAPTLSPVTSDGAAENEASNETTNGVGASVMMNTVGDGISNDAVTKLKGIIDDDEELDALLTELDNDTGMTIERQDEIQSSLMKMLGGNADASSAKDAEEEDHAKRSPWEDQEEGCLAEDVMALGLACCQSVEDARKEEDG